MHFFGKFGILFSVSGLIINLYLTYQWINYQIFPDGEFTVMRPLFFLGILLIVIGVQFFSIGFIGEIIVRKSSVESPVNMNILYRYPENLGIK